MIKLLSTFKDYLYSIKFIKHNKKVFKKKERNTKNIILVEINSLHSSIIAYSYLANFLSDYYDANIHAYKFNVQKKILYKIYNFINLKNIINYSKIYKSFGVNRIFENNLTFDEKQQSMLISDKIYKSLKTKKNVLDIIIDGIEIGDLLYDSFLKKYNEATIDIKEEKFKNFLFHFIEIYFFWKKYLENNNVKALIVSHCVYHQALPLRLAISKNIPSFQASAAYIYRLSKNQKFAYKEYFDYKKEFLKLPEYKKVDGIREAKHRLQQRFSGKVGIDLRYSKKSAYGKFLNTRLLKNNDKIKILIATHCFSDSPHSFGELLFPDFYEWINFLGKLSAKRDYDWYLKTHPDFIQSTRNRIKSFVKKYDRFELLPAEASHLQIIDEGINFVLTCHGTIGHEYAAKGKTVINASLNNPHISYNFNIHPKNIQEYENLLLNLKNINFSFDKKEVYEFYYMKYINEKANWLFKNHNELIKNIGYYAQFNPVIYKIFLDQFSEDRHNEVLKSLKNFINGNDYLFIPPD